MKILVLCYEYPPIGGGGGRVAKTVAEALAARGHEVRVQTAALGWTSQRETIGGVEIFRTASGRRAPDTCRVHEMAAYCATSFLPALRHIREWQPDVIHAHFAMPTGMLAWALHRLTRTPYVLTAHLGDVPGGVPEQTDKLFRLIGPLAKLVWHDAAACTAVSSFVQQLAERAYGRNVERILNGIDLSAQTPPSPVRDTRHLIFVGRFNPQKRPDFLIDVLARVADLDWRATLVGDGPLMPAVRAKIEQHGLGERIALRGWLGGAEVEAVLRDADAFLLPSSSEGLPVASIEALKHGLAVVASNIPGVADVVDDGQNGFLLPLNDLGAWDDKLRGLLTQPDALSSMKAASWKKAREFDLGAIATQYEAVLKAATCR